MSPSTYDEYYHNDMEGHINLGRQFIQEEV